MRLSVPPFGWLQELLSTRFPGKKLSTKRLKALTYIKYFALLFAVVVLPVLVVNDVGWATRSLQVYLSAGRARGAIPLSITNAGIRSALGQLFTWKLFVLIAVVVLSVLFYRPFLQVDLPAGGILWAHEQGVLAGNSSRRMQMHLVRHDARRFARWTSM